MGSNAVDEVVMRRGILREPRGKRRDGIKKGVRIDPEELRTGAGASGNQHDAAPGRPREIGIDLAGAKPQRLTDELAASAQLLVTMGCGETCPVVPGLQRLDWSLADPKGQSVAAVRAIRDEIRALVDELIGRNDWQRDR